MAAFPCGVFQDLISNDQEDAQCLCDGIKQLYILKSSMPFRFSYACKLYTKWNKK